MKFLDIVSLAAWIAVWIDFWNFLGKLTTKLLGI
jgi:hypothetical protein